MSAPAVKALSKVMPVLPRGAGDRRAANAVFRRWMTGRPEAATTSVGGAEMMLSLDDWPQAQAFLLGRYDTSTVEFILENLPSGGTFVEGGAHVGLIAMQVAHARPIAHLHAFEPHPTKFAALKANAERNGVDLHANPVGLSDAAGARPYDVQRHAVDDGASGSIPVVTLDDYADQHQIEHIDVLKLDIEGHEINALRGARKLIEDGRIGAITMEATHETDGDPLTYLKELGFSRVRMPDTRAGWIVARRPEQQLENVGFVLSR